MEASENGEVSVMSEVDISEELPNGDDSAFAPEDHQQQEAHGQEEENEENCQPVVSLHPVQTSETVTIAANQPHSGITADHVFVATSEGLLTAQQLQEAGIKTTHIVIHDQTLTVDPSGLKTPTTPLPPPTPATPLSREKGLKYQWDDSVNQSVLPVRCKSSNGELHKAKFGSGGRGRCIKMGDIWYTPSEFEAVCGRASSKDWKRSIRYGGRTLQCLIEDGVLQPHATSCTCAACCDDETVTGPVRLFVPYKRRKPSHEGPLPISKKRVTTSKSGSVGTSPVKDTVVVSLAPGIATPVRVNNSETGETVQIIAADASGNIVTEPAVMMPLPQTPKSAAVPNVVDVEVNEQKQWWQIEEMANSLLAQAQQLKAMVELCKQQSVAAKEVAIQSVKVQADKEKTEALNALRIEAQMNLSRAVMEERAQRDIAIQQALAQARADMQEKMEGVNVVPVSSDDKVTYQVSWTHQNNTGNIDSIMVEEEEEDVEDSDKEKE